MNDIIALARTKEARTTGGNVSYYLIEVVDSLTGAVIVVEVEDIIEALAMEFGEGNVFKAAVRIAKSRQNLGKPGVEAVYDAEKIVYYTARTIAQAQRRSVRMRRPLARLAAWIAPAPDAVSYDASGGLVITVAQPKRLEPYRVSTEDMIDALSPTPAERAMIAAHLDQCAASRTGQTRKALASAHVAADAAALVLAENQRAETEDRRTS